MSTATAPAGLAQFYTQDLDWRPSDREDLPGVEVATLAVPLDYGVPDGRAISLTIGRHPATSKDQRLGTLLVGPGDDLGNPGLPLVARLAQSLPADVLARYDLVGFDHRFMGESTPLFAGLTPEERLWVFHYPVSFADEVRYQATVAAKVAESAPEYLPHASTRNIARDMDVIRGALGEERISYLGYSYCTYLGAVYTQMFGERTDRVVLDSLCSPDWVWRGLFLDFPPNAEKALARWVRWAAARDDQVHLGTTEEAVRSSYERLIQRADAGESVSTGEFELDRTLVRLIGVGMLNSDHAYEALAEVIRVGNDGGELAPMISAFLRPVFGTPKEESGTVAQVAVLAGDWRWPRDLGGYREDMATYATRYPFSGASHAGIKAPAFWPVLPREPVTPLGPGNRAPSILLVQADQDMSTPLAAARRMRAVLAHNSRLATVADSAHHRVFPFYGNEAVNEVVTTYLVDGQLPEQDVTCPNPRARL